MCIAEEAEVEQFYEDLQDWNAKEGSQETPGLTRKFGLGVWNEARQRLIEFCQVNALVKQESSLEKGIHKTQQSEN